MLRTFSHSRHDAYLHVLRLGKFVIITRRVHCLFLLVRRTQIRAAVFYTHQRWFPSVERRGGGGPICILTPLIICMHSQANWDIICWLKINTLGSQSGFMAINRDQKWTDVSKKWHEINFENKRFTWCWKTRISCSQRKQFVIFADIYIILFLDKK